MLYHKDFKSKEEKYLQHLSQELISLIMKGLQKFRSKTQPNDLRKSKNHLQKDNTLKRKYRIVLSHSQLEKCRLKVLKNIRYCPRQHFFWLSPYFIVRNPLLLPPEYSFLFLLILAPRESIYEIYFFHIHSSDNT